ncbi:hypothetical protein [Embleya scabrispora]|uniref:hypothetical protein n=1 Tax=Embleya scabrispora TaxID=159449 RepID=UPI0003AA4590|nr:hypothetical protein [Embleya scabrispora]MYS82100.1 hypothetical protein [Streptomyces sp. SID5474]
MSVDFTRDIDAVTFCNGSFWFFKGDECVSIDGSSDKVDKGPMEIIAAGAFPALKSPGCAQFADTPDAVVAPTGGGGFWFFKGDQCVKVNGAGDEIVYGPFGITAPDAFPHLPGR